MFKIREVKELPSRTFKKPSKYDHYLEEFMATGYDKGEIQCSGVISAEYLSAQLSKRLKHYPRVEVHTRNGNVYLTRSKLDLDKEFKDV